AEWCRGFFYAGPRCNGDFHGAVLGTATVDMTGLVTDFDLWRGRRWVMTGPLVGHFGAQLGLASLDVVVGRLVDSICCLGLGKLQTAGIWMALPPLGTQTPSVTLAMGGGTIDLGAIAKAGIFLSDGVYLLFGSSASIADLFARCGLETVASQAVGALGF